MSDSDRPSLARFGDFDLDLRTGEVRHQSQRLSLAGQPVQLLELLLRRSGEVVPMGELQRALWPADVHVDFEHGLRAVVWRLRTALGDTADEPKWIETVPRKGYRYIGPAPEWVSVPRTIARRRLSYRSAAAVLAVAAIAIIGIAFSLVGQRSSRAVVAVLSADNLTGEPGLASLCETMTEELISRLGQVDPARLGVIARSESRQFRNVTQLTYALRVDFVVEAGLVRQNGRLRLNVRLVRIGDRTQVWGSSFDVGTEAPTMASTEVAQSVSESVQEALGLMDGR